MKSGNFNFLETSGPLQACNGTALSLSFIITKRVVVRQVPDKQEGLSGVGGLGVSALAFGTQVRGFKPGRSRWIFQGEKFLSAPFFGREEKPWFPCR
jgi:hypothetical protein